MALIKEDFLKLHQELKKLAGGSCRISHAAGQHEDVTHKNSQIGLRGSSDHVRNETFVAGGVEDGEVLLLSLEVGSAHLHSLAFVALWRK